MVKLQEILLLFLLFLSTPFISNAQPGTLQVISDITDSIAQKLGWKPDDVRVSRIKFPDVLIGQTTLYEFDLEIGNVVFPLKLSEEITSWQPMKDVSSSEDVKGGDGLDESSLAKQNDHFNPVLAPFQLAGPLELWIQDADNMRLSVPHDVEAGILKKVVLADGAVVTVKGAKELHLRQPIRLPLPLSNSEDDSNLASSLIALASKLRDVSQNSAKPLSLRIVGPSSLVASTVSDINSASKRLKVKRLAPGSVELVSRQVETSSPISVEPVDSYLQQAWMWPIPSVNSSNARLKGFENLLKATLGSNAKNEESIRLLRARAAAATFIKLEFEIEKKLASEEFSSNLWPEWRTKPSVAHFHFELVAKLEGDKITPVKVQQVVPLQTVETLSESLLTGNVSMSKMEVHHLPPSLMTL